MLGLGRAKEVEGLHLPILGEWGGNKADGGGRGGCSSDDYKSSSMSKGSWLSYLFIYFYFIEVF